MNISCKDGSIFTNPFSNRHQEIKYSIIIPTYNRFEQTLECLNSVLAIPRNDFEIIIVDDCSTDDSVALIRKVEEPRVSVLVNDKNSGASFSRNNGAYKAQGMYLFFLDSDTEVEPKILDLFDNVLESQNNVGMVGPLICYFEQKNRIQSAGVRIDLMTSKAVGRRYCENISSISNCTEKLKGGHIQTAFVVPKEIFFKVGGFDNLFFIMYEESDLAMKIELLVGKSIFFEPKAIVYHKTPLPENVRGIISFLRTVWFKNSKIAYYTSRNRIIFMKRYSKNFYVFLGIFMPAMLAIYSVQCLLNLRFDLLLALFRGTLDGLVLALRKQ